MVTFFESPSDADEAALLTDLQAELAATLRETPNGDVSALPFSTQLIAATGEESAIEVTSFSSSAPSASSAWRCCWSTGPVRVCAACSAFGAPSPTRW